MSDQPRQDPQYAPLTDAIVEPPQSLWGALRKIGPGIILAGSIVGSGELILTTSLGAEWGFTFLWLILFSCVIKVFVQIELGRYAISSGKPTLTALNELPGLKFGGAQWMVWWWLLMMLTTITQLGAMVGGVGQALNFAFPHVSIRLAAFFGSNASAIGAGLSQHPEYPWCVLTAFAAIALLLTGGYKSIERITTALVAGVTLITVICVAALPATGYPIQLDEIIHGLSFGLPAAGIAAAFSTFGITGVGASELFSYPYWCLEKGYARFAGPCSSDPDWSRRARGWIRVMVLDAWVSMIVFTVATVAFYCLGATVLHRQDLHPKGPEMIRTLSQMYIPSFGQWTELVFLIGAWAVLFKTLYVASAGNSRLVADFLSLTGALSYSDVHARMRTVRLLCVAFPTVALVLYLFFRDPRGMVVIGGFAQAATLPMISGAALFLRYRRTDPRIAPSTISDFCLWLAVILISIVAFKAIYDWGAKDLLPLLQSPTKPTSISTSVPQPASLTSTTTTAHKSDDEIQLPVQRSDNDWPEEDDLNAIIRSRSERAPILMAEYARAKPTRAFSAKHRTFFIARDHAATGSDGFSKADSTPPSPGEPSVQCIDIFQMGFYTYAPIHESIQVVGLAIPKGGGTEVSLQIDFKVSEKLSGLLGVPRDRVLSATLPWNEIMQLTEVAKLGSPPPTDGEDPYWHDAKKLLISAGIPAAKVAALAPWK